MNNHQTDPLEMTNLYGDAEVAEVQAALEARLAFFNATAIGDPFIPAERVDGQLFDSQGGIVPFLDFNTPPPKVALPAVTADPLAPNIVFVILDDGMDFLMQHRIRMTLTIFLICLCSGVERRGVAR